MNKNDHHIITLCGSSRQKEDWEFYRRKLALEGNVVLAIDVYIGLETAYYNDDTTTKRLLMSLHRQKIRMAQEICFIRKPNGQLGKHTTSELIYAKKLKKQITFFVSTLKVS